MKNSKKIIEIVSKIKSQNETIVQEGMAELHKQICAVYFPQAKKIVNFRNVEWEDVRSDTEKHIMSTRLEDYNSKEMFNAYYINLVKRYAYSQIAKKIGVHENNLYLLSKMKEISSKHGIPLTWNNLYKFAQFCKKSITQCETALNSNIQLISLDALDEYFDENNYD